MAYEVVYVGEDYGLRIGGALVRIFVKVRNPVEVW
jgi:hypothetical protein